MLCFRDTFGYHGERGTLYFAYSREALPAALRRSMALQPVSTDAWYLADIIIEVERHGYATRCPNQMMIVNACLTEGHIQAV